MNYLLLLPKVCMRCIAVCCAVALTGLVLLWLVAELPQAPLRANIQNAFAQGELGENYPQYLLFRATDNYTECVGLTLATHLTGDIEHLLGMYGSGECNALRQAVQQNFPPAHNLYARYWHGSQVVLKPLYTFFSREVVRNICIGIGLSLLSLFGFVSYKKLGIHVSFSLLAGFILTTSLSVFPLATHGLQLWWTLIAAILVCIRKEKTLPYTLFATIGAGNAFVTYLNAETVSLSIPLFCWCAVQLRDDVRTQDIFIQAIVLCAAWSIGYLGLWLIKWGLCWYFLPNLSGFFGNTLGAYAPRSFSIIGQAILSNLMRTPWTVCVGVLALLALRYKKYHLQPVKHVWIFLLPAILPVIWMCLLPGHAERHSMFMTILYWPTISAACLALLGEHRGTTAK